MRIYHSTKSTLHTPSSYYRRGAVVDHPEQAARYTVLHDAALQAGHDMVLAGDHGADPIAAVHDADYLTFLESAWSRRAEVPGLATEIGSSHFSRPHMSRRPTGLLGLIGYHMADTSTPVQAGTWEAIYGSAQAAIAASDCVGKGAVGASYALCRPPGHHAFANSSGGFCFLNNTAIAARHLARVRNGRIAVLDIDVHHGNGTQGIFFSCADILTISVHADPQNYFPFYAGYADEIGAGPGAGFNLNLPLTEGIGDAVWVQTIAAAVSRIAAFQPEAVVVALGFDASEHDPIGAFKVTTSGFEAAAVMIAGLGLPTVLVQEGGYLCQALPVNLVRFLAQFQAAHTGW